MPSSGTRLEFGSFEPAGPKPPKIPNIAALEKTVNTLESRMSLFGGAKYDGTEARTICLAWCRELRVSVVDWPLVDASLQHLQGKRITGGILRASAARLVHNKHMLLEGKAIPQWTGQPPVWALVEVSRVEKTEVWSQTRQNVVPLVRVSLRAFTGPLAGGIVTVLQTPSYAKVALKELGVAKYTKAVDPLELFQMRTWAMLETAEKGGIAAKLVASSSQREFNRRLYKARYYERPDWCRRQVACHACPETTEKCDRACRPARSSAESKPT